MKKILSVILALTIVISMSVSATAMTTRLKIATVDTTMFGETIELLASNGRVVLYSNGTPKVISGVDKLANLTVEPGDELRIALSPAMFKDSSGTRLGEVDGNISISTLSAGGISLKVSRSGADETSGISISGDKTHSYISMMFDGGDSQSTRFNYSLYLSQHGKVLKSTRIDVKGSMADDVSDYGEDEDYVDLSHGASYRSNSSNANVEFYLGNNVSIFKKVPRGKQVFGEAIDEISNQDQDLLSRYNGIEYVYTMVVSDQLQGPGHTVVFDLNEKLYVYNARGQYIGRTTDALPYSDKYYLSVTKYDSI